MLFENLETTRMVELIRRGARTWTKGELASVLEAARARKDPELDAASKGAQMRYRGRQTSVMRAALRRAFPQTGDTMPVAAINWLRLVARLDAGVYVVPPDRWIDDADGNRIASEDPRAKLWTWALRQSQFHTKMSECERRALITPGSVFGHGVWVKPPGDSIGFPRIDLYWPHDVESLCHWSAPTSWTHKYVVALRQASPDASSKGDWYRVWSRDAPSGLSGEWGQWTSTLLSTEGEQASDSAAAEVYPGSLLPVFLVQLSDPEGFAVVLEDTDLLDVVDDLNRRRANESYVIDLQGHNQMWTDDPKEENAARVGPDVMLRVLPGRQVGLLQPQPLLGDMRESRKLATRELAISRGNSPDAYATEPGPPLSGVAKRVANLVHDTRIAEQATLMQQIEEGEPLQILLDMVRTFHPQGRILEGVVPRMSPRRLPVIEDPNQRQQRLGEAFDRGWISAPRAAADAELYSTVEEAAAAISALATGDDEEDRPAASDEQRKQAGPDEKSTP